MMMRKESVEITISCDMKECNNENRYIDELGPYNSGWRTINVRVYDKYSDRHELDIIMHVCSSCMSLFKDFE